MARQTKTYPAVSGPNASTAAVLPANPKRIGLFIQNTGANPGNRRFGGPVQGVGGDALLTTGQFHQWDQKDSCPLESVSVGSVLATTWVIEETVDD